MFAGPPFLDVEPQRPFQLRSQHLGLEHCELAPVLVHLLDEFPRLLLYLLRRAALYFDELCLPKALDLLQGVEDLEFPDRLEVALFGVLGLEVLQIALLNLLEVWVLAVVVEKALQFIDIFLRFLRHCLLLCDHFLGRGLFWRGWSRRIISFAA